MLTSKFTRRAAIGIFSLMTFSASFTASAQDGKPIEWVVGYAAGGGSDVVARSVAEAMSKTLGQPILINNKPGAATNIAADYVARSKDPGHMMFTADFATLAANHRCLQNFPMTR